MKLHRFFVEGLRLETHVSLTDPALCHQLSRVLRMRAGDSILLCDGNGNQAQAELCSIAANRVDMRLGAASRVPGEPARAVTLYCAVLKRENMEWVVQKAVECGASRIIPVLTARTVKSGLKLARVQSIAKEAAEQSGRGIVPQVVEPVPFASAAADAQGPQIFFHVGSGADWTHVLSGAKTASLWIGPEGGWTEQECRHATSAGWHMASLGALTLRAETAAVVASYVAVHASLLGD